jgi:hypothetical protein
MVNNDIDDNGDDDGSNASDGNGDDDDFQTDDSDLTPHLLSVQRGSTTTT